MIMTPERPRGVPLSSAVAGVGVHDDDDDNNDDDGMRPFYPPTLSTALPPSPAALMAPLTPGSPDSVSESHSWFGSTPDKLGLLSIGTDLEVLESGASARLCVRRRLSLVEHLSLPVALLCEVTVSLASRCPRPLSLVVSVLLGRVARVFYVGALVWGFFCLQSLVPVCALAIGRGCPWRGPAFWFRLAVVVLCGPLPSCILTIRYWDRFLFAPPGGLFRRYVLDKLGRALVMSSGFLTLAMTWIAVVLIFASGVLHWLSAVFVFVVVFNSLVTLWFLFGQEALMAAALRTFRRRSSFTSVVSLIVCVVLLAEPFAAAIVASAYPGTLSLATFLKLQTGLGACLGLLSKCMGVFEKIRARADEYERRARERKERQQQRKTRFASI